MQCLMKLILIFDAFDNYFHSVFLFLGVSSYIMALVTLVSVRHIKNRRFRAGCSMLVHSNDPINRRWKNSLNDVRVYRGADVGSDHNLAVSTVRLSLAALKKQKEQRRYNTVNLLNRDILHHCQQIPCPCRPR